MNVELTRIAEKKLEQMGATVHGVLVKNEAGAWAAVSEGGRVMWLDDFEGEAESAQSGQGAEAAAWMRWRSHRIAADDVMEGLEICEPGEVGDDGGPAFPVYTQPQPSQQGVPDELREKALELCRAVENEEEFPPAKFALRCLMLVNQVRRLAATPQPEDDGWIKCSERLPKLGQRVQLFSQGVIQHMMPLFDDSDEGLFWDFEVHDYNPPVDMSHDQWRPLPQPPKEGSGDE